ncbi:MAG: BlaI/MecI/CopY family transcriptional regulator [Pyrinomonadaceae bacterium]|nr:BlaI/MecI/CopY family transcriptional regulator [Pyrinomonadaceae bacterium]
MAKQPTTSELEILNILWEKECATVREVFEIISETKSITYTTVLKLMQIMTEKDLVEREEQGKAHLYRAKIAQTETQKGLVSELLEKVFRGSAMQLVQHLLETKKTSPQEMKEIRKMIQKAEKEAKNE